jgi:hypothetical protein
MRSTVIVYHRTHHAEAIERRGFRDDHYVMPGIGELRGIFVSALWPPDKEESGDGDILFELEIPEALFVEHEHVEYGKSCRSALIPAALLNQHRGTLHRLSRNEETRLSVERWGLVRRDL